MTDTGDDDAGPPPGRKCAPRYLAPGMGAVGSRDGQTRCCHPVLQVVVGRVVPLQRRQIEEQRAVRPISAMRSLRTHEPAAAAVDGAATVLRRTKVDHVPRRLPWILITSAVARQPGLVGGAGNGGPVQLASPHIRQGEAQQAPASGASPDWASGCPMPFCVALEAADRARMCRRVPSVNAGSVSI